eukprot:5840884-Amphidinium_carterae.2
MPQDGKVLFDISLPSEVGPLFGDPPPFPFYLPWVLLQGIHMSCRRHYATIDHVHSSDPC